MCQAVRRTAKEPRVARGRKKDGAVGGGGGLGGEVRKAGRSRAQTASLAVTVSEMENPRGGEEAVR